MAPTASDLEAKTTPEQDDELPVGEPSWYRSPWLVPVAGLTVVVVVDLAAGATAVVIAGVIVVGFAIALLGVPAITNPGHGAILVAALLVAVTATLVALDRPSVRRALEPATKSSSRPKPGTAGPPRSLRGMIVRRDQVKAHDLRNVDFTASTLDGLDLRQRLLDDDHLEGAWLAGADLRGAQLRGAHLEGASIRGARLNRACLVGAHVEGADFTGATLAGADVTGVHGQNAVRRAAASWPTHKASSSVCR